MVSTKWRAVLLVRRRPIPPRPTAVSTVSIPELTVSRMTKRQTRRVLGHSLAPHCLFIHLLRTAHSFTCSALLTHLLAPHCSLICSLRTTHSFAFSLLILSLTHTTRSFVCSHCSTTRSRAHRRKFFVYDMNMSISYSFNPLCSRGIGRVGEKLRRRGRGDCRRRRRSSSSRRRP